jgi:hypothetical protein
MYLPETPPPPPCARRADGATLSQLSKALSGKLSGGEAPQDLLAALWGFAHLNHKPDAGLISKAAAAIKGAVGELTPEQQICAAWSLALLGGGDKDVFGALFGALGAALAAAPDSVPVAQLALLAEAQAMAGDKAKLPEQVWGLGARASLTMLVCLRKTRCSGLRRSHCSPTLRSAPPPPSPRVQVGRYVLGMHSVAAEAAKERSGAGGKEFRKAVAAATARAMGARYKPEIAAAVKGMPTRTADGLTVDFAIDALKVCRGGGVLSGSATRGAGLHTHLEGCCGCAGVRCA